MYRPNFLRNTTSKLLAQQCGAAQGARRCLQRAQVNSNALDGYVRMHW